MKPLIRFEMNSQKGKAFLEILLDKLEGKFNYISLLKLAFFADRYHLRNYARPIVGDVYYAMRYGAVPSNLKDILDMQDMFDGNIKKKNNNIVELKSKNNIDKTLFSTSDIEAITFSVDKFAEIGKKSTWNLPNLTHAFPEWEKYKDNFSGDNANSRYEMDYLDFLKNAPPNHSEFIKLQFTNPYVPLTEYDREDLIEEIKEINILYGDS